MEMIKVSAITLQRNNQMLFQDFSASFANASISAVVGPNGCGKSSLLLAISGDLTPLSGAIFIDGNDVSELSDLEQSLLRSMALQERTFWLPMTVREVLTLGNGPEVVKNIDQVAMELGISELLSALVTTLSVGQIQRVEIARTVLRDVPIYLFDEPFAAQDMASRESLIEILKGLRAAGKTVILIVHSEVEKLSWCDQIIQLGS